MIAFDFDELEIVNGDYKRNRRAATKAQARRSKVECKGRGSLPARLF
jgi:hypothetical protein